jgi:UDP-N-acetylmuramyl pentapeptide synthase
LSYRVTEIKDIIGADQLQQGDDTLIEHLLTDSRKLLFPESSLFFALPGQNRSGSSFIRSLYDKGMRSFVVSAADKIEARLFPAANLLAVNDVLAALQKLASFHRHRFHFPVIGITGSNGKTIVKEWLAQLSGDDLNIVRSPKSYNSQVGVPLSLWRMNESNELGIFESGISKPGEMERLQAMIDPGIGVVTFIGSAHAEGFEDTEQKIREKLKLFANSKLIIYNKDDEKLDAAVKELQQQNPALKTFTRSRKAMRIFCLDR